MKRCECFRVLRLTLYAVSTLLLASSCVDHDEMEFKGKVLYIRDCTGSFMDASAGFVVQLEYPEGVGGEIIDDAGKPMNNIIVLYEPTCRVYADDKIHGTFYLDPKYSRANCTLHYDDYDLPEGVMTKTVVD